MRVSVCQFDGVATMRVLPLAAGQVVAAARAGGGGEFEIWTERGEVDEVAGRVRGDVVGFSCYTWNLRYSLEVGRRLGRFGRAGGGGMVVLGGPSVPRRAARVEGFLREHPWVDVLVLGEGEVAFREIVRGRDLDGIPGVAFRAGGRVVVNPRARIREFEGLGSPYLDGTFDGMWGEGFQAAVLESNRGCPFSCTFCDWGQAVASRVHELPLERVRAEIEWIGRRAIPYVYLIDANFGIRPRDPEIVRALGEVRRATGAPAYCYFHLTKNATTRNLATVEVLREYGVGCQVALSMQDFDPSVLRAIKRHNIKLEASLELRQACSERGIPTHNELLLGLPEQTYESFRSSVVKALSPYPDDGWFLYLCRLLENAEMAEQVEEFGIRTRSCVVGSANHARVDGHVAEREDIIVGTRAMPPAEWRRAYRLGNLLAAFHTLRWMHLVLHWIAFDHDEDVAGWVEAVLDAMEQAEPDSALGALDSVLDGYVRSIRSGGALVLPLPGAESHVWTVGEALLSCALQRRDDFFREVEACTIAWRPGLPLVSEVLEYQRLLTPGLDRVDAELVVLEHDWPAWDAGRGGRLALPQRRVRLGYVPPHHAREADGWVGFLRTHVQQAYSKMVGNGGILRALG